METESLLLRDDSRRARNRLAQRRHRERKKGTGNTINSTEIAASQCAATDSSDARLTSSLPATTLPTPTWDGDNLNMIGAFDHNLESFSRLKNIETDRRSPSNLASAFASTGSTTHAGIEDSAVTEEEILAIVGDGFPSHTYKIPGCFEGMTKEQYIQTLSPFISPQPGYDSTRDDRGGDSSGSYFHGRNSSAGSEKQHGQYVIQPLHRRGDSERCHISRKTRQESRGGSEGHHHPPSMSRNLFTTDHLEGHAMQTPDSTVRDTSPRSNSPDWRLESVLKTVEDTGFDSIDSMTKTYYTSEFSEDSIIRPMQSASRSTRLRTLLSALQSSYKSWSSRERSGYIEAVVQSAENICSDELRELYGSRSPHRGMSHTHNAGLNDGGGNSVPVQAHRNETANQIWEVLSSPDISEFMQKDKTALQDLVPETWSMMMELARKAGMQPQERAQVACIVVYLLTNVRPEHRGSNVRP